MSKEEADEAVINKKFNSKSFYGLSQEKARKMEQACVELAINESLKEAANGPPGGIPSQTVIEQTKKPQSNIDAPKIQSYDEAFPSLVDGPAPTQAVVSSFNNPMKSIKGSTTSITFQIPFEQRRFRPGAATEFGKGTAGDRGKAECLKIMNETKVGFRPNER